MQAAVVSLLVQMWAWVLQGAPVLPEAQILPQENFNLSRFMGQWFEVAVVSTCPLYMGHKRGNPAIVAVELKHIETQANVVMTSRTISNGSCEQRSRNCSLTNTPGRFFYHVARFLSDVDSYVVHTNYDEFAMLVLLTKDRPSGNTNTIAKLYSRTMDVRDAVMVDFKTLVRQQEMSDDTIIKNQNKGVCTPGEQVTTPQYQGHDLKV